MMRFQTEHPEESEILAAACTIQVLDLQRRRMILMFTYEPSYANDMKNLLDRHMFRDTQVFQYTDDQGQHHIIVDPSMIVPLPPNQYEVRYIIYAHAVTELNTTGEKK